jgi:hypothetical protein
MQNAIRTNMDPKEFRLKHGTILCRHARFELTATTEIVNEGVDAETQLQAMDVGLHFPGLSSGGTISLAVMKSQGCKTVAVKKPDYMLTQKDFEAVIRGKVIDVPTHN